MFENLKIFETSHAMARHAGARQAVTATNMANADTPGYRAMAIAPFSETFSDANASALRQTRAGHTALLASSTNTTSSPADAQASPNGNSVSLEQEMVMAVEIQREHSRALAIYKHSLDVLRMSLGRR